MTLYHNKCADVEVKIVDRPWLVSRYVVMCNFRNTGWRDHTATDSFKDANNVYQELQQAALIREHLACK